MEKIIIETLERKEAELLEILKLQNVEKNKSRELYKNEIEVRAQISILLHLLYKFNDVIISTKKLKKYDRSRYKGEIINGISITGGGGIIIETDKYKETFNTCNAEDIIKNIDSYDADYIICMIQYIDGIDVNKY